MVEGPIGAAAFNNEFGRPGLGGFFRVYEQTRRRRPPRLPQADHERGRPRLDQRRPTEKVRFPAGHPAGPARRSRHADRDGWWRGLLDGGRGQRRRTRLRLRAARQPRDRAARAGGHQPLLEPGRRQPDPGHPRRRRGRAVQRLPRAGRRRRARAHGSTCPRCRSRSRGWRPRRCGATRARSATSWPSRRSRWTRFAALCERERCPFAVVGVARDDGQLVLAPGRGRRGRRPADRHADGGAARQAAADDPRRDPGRAARRRLDVGPAGRRARGGVRRAAAPDRGRSGSSSRSPTAPSAGSTTATRWSGPGRCLWPTSP